MSVFHPRCGWWEALDGWVVEALPLVGWVIIFGSMLGIMDPRGGYSPVTIRA